MFARRIPQSVARFDRQVSHLRLLRSGKCARCYHASLRRAKESSAEEAPPRSANAPSSGPSRRKRAADAAAAVKMLERDHPSPSFGEADPNTLRSPGSSNTVDPEAIGQNVSPGRMGENDTTTQEGPQAQGVARVVSFDDDLPDTSRQARGVRDPHDAVEDPSAGGTSVLEATAPSTSDTTAPSPKLPSGVAAQHRRGSERSGSSPAAVSPTHFNPERYSPAILAGGGAKGIIQDRINSIANAGMLDATRGVGYLAQRLMNGQLVQFESKEEKAAVEEAAKAIAEQKAQDPLREKLGITKTPAHNSAPLKDVLQGMVKSTVAGRYRGRKLLRGPDKDNSGRPLLNTVSRLTLLNSTFLLKDRVRVLEKVRSLLPKPTASKRDVKRL